MRHSDSREQEENVDGDSFDLKGFLVNMGYRLSDEGAHWRSPAIYREGNNPSALRISKRTGSFVDFVESKSGTFKDLIELTTGKKIGKLRDYLSKNNINFDPTINKEKALLVQEKTFPVSILQNLHPIYSFYCKRERPIDKRILIELRSGIAQKGQMYMRYVFPIFNKDGEIHGFQGRDITGKKEDKDKWKKIGKSVNWIYPAFVPTPSGEFPVLNAIREKKVIIICESIGDMLALRSAGYDNVVVTFGTAFSDNLAAFIASESPDLIIVATNNDFQAKKNVGEEFAHKIFMRLHMFTNFKKVVVSLPKKKDFGVMQDEEIDEWYQETLQIGEHRQEMYKKALDYIRIARNNDSKNKNLTLLEQAVENEI